MGLHLDRKFIAVGILIVLLSTLFATQYATTKVSFQYAIVHPSNADIRFVGSDNSSDDGWRVLRVSGDNGTNAKIGLEFGDWSANMNNTYTAAFAIVNEEPFAVNITYVSVTNTSGNSDYMQIWLHGNGSLKAEDDPTSVFLYNNGTTYYTASSTAWVLAKGDGDASTMYPNISDSGTMISTTWDESAHVRYTTNLSGGNDDAFQIGSNGRTRDNASDFVWVQISINVPAGAVGDAHAGTIEVHFQASTHWNGPPYRLDVGSASVFESASTSYISIASLDNSHVVIAYRDAGNGNRGTAVVGTISGSTISFGTPAVFKSGTTSAVSITALNGTDVFIAYCDGSYGNEGAGIVGRWDGQDGASADISFGSNSTFPVSIFEECTIISVTTLDSTHVIVAFENENDGKGEAAVGTISGTSITFGTASTFLSADAELISLDSFNGTAAVFAYSSNENPLYGRIGTWDSQDGAAADLSYGGTATDNDVAPVSSISCARLTSTSAVTAFDDWNNNNYGTMVVGTISGNSISFGDDYIFNSGTSDYISVTALDSTTVLVSYYC